MQEAKFKVGEMIEGQETRGRILAQEGETYRVLWRPTGFKKEHFISEVKINVVDCFYKKVPQYAKPQ